MGRIAINLTQSIVDNLRPAKRFKYKGEEFSIITDLSIREPLAVRFGKKGWNFIWQPRIKGKKTTITICRAGRDQIPLREVHARINRARDAIEKNTPNIIPSILDGLENPTAPSFVREDMPTWGQLKKSFLEFAPNKWAARTVAGYRYHLGLSGIANNLPDDLSLDNPLIVPYAQKAIYELEEDDSFGVDIPRLAKNTLKRTLEHIKHDPIIWERYGLEKQLPLEGRTLTLMNANYQLNVASIDIDNFDGDVIEIALLRSGLQKLIKSYRHNRSAAGALLVVISMHRCAHVAQTRIQHFFHCRNGDDRLYVWHKPARKSAIRTNKKQQTVPLEGVSKLLVQSIIERHANYEDNPHEYLFPTKKAKNTKQSYQDGKAIREAFRRAFDGHTPHSIRRSFATHVKTNAKLLKEHKSEVLSHGSTSKDVIDVHYDFDGNLDNKLRALKEWYKIIELDKAFDEANRK